MKFKNILVSVGMVMMFVAPRLARADDLRCLNGWTFDRNGFIGPLNLTVAGPGQATGSTVLVRLIAIPIAARCDKVWLRAAACALGEVVVFHSLLLANGQTWRTFLLGAGCVLVQLALFRKLFSVTIPRAALVGTAHSAAVALIRKDKTG